MPSQTIYNKAPDAHEHLPDAPDGRVQLATRSSRAQTSSSTTGGTRAARRTRPFPVHEYPPQRQARQ